MPEREVEVKVRQMTVADTDSILRLGGSMISREDLIALEPGGSIDMSFVAEVNGQIIGFNIAQVQYYGIPITKVCVISGIVVDHEYRRHGIGNRLVQAVFRRCHEKGVDTVRALVEDGDTRLTRFAEQLGFYHSTINNYDKNVHNYS
jgi:ribosomal protein S18 acetylase RimI-like enzyme